MHQFEPLISLLDPRLHRLERLSQELVLARYRILLKDFLEEVVSLGVLLNFLEQRDQLFWRFGCLVEQEFLLVNPYFILFVNLGESFDKGKESLAESE